MSACAIEYAAHSMPALPGVLAVANSGVRAAGREASRSVCVGESGDGPAIAAPGAEDEPCPWEIGNGGKRLRYARSGQVGKIRVQKRAGAPSHRLSGFGWSGVGGGRDRDPAWGEGRIRIAVNEREVVERCAEGKLVKREKGEMECMERRREEKEKEECADGSYWQARDPRAMHYGPGGCARIQHEKTKEIPGAGARAQLRRMQYGHRGGFSGEQRMLGHIHHRLRTISRAVATARRSGVRWGSSDAVP
ncbi:predicted protein [Postia placenta Mad-698-R]|uniref:Uncharacterized protein n=1 Tax=Postia placenta MAD-698-R-SB12 TaxID=670580 RepID=A0A1X6N0K9_9APHY|nr:hypothetical protein POSPLADRAFT_1143675 [Postia placenta MAD-698-R-SB12]EED82734.1 predicted protein [Postia placenta Mad-698-R]OSX62020.1 hypothetical protein POSPLADRAFT_1143675 [Postia placenta MAD-698-R-SB12]